MYPAYQDEVAFVAVGFGSSQDIEQLGAYQDAEDMPMTFAEGPDDLVREYEVATQSTKFLIGRDGVILARFGYGHSGADVWEERLEELASR